MTSQGIDLRTRHYDLLPVDSTSVATSVRTLHQCMGPDRKKVFVIGAGVSSAAGISTFKDRNGLIQKSGGKAMLSELVFLTTEGTSKFHAMIHKMACEAAEAEPTLFHKLLNEFARRGDDLRIYTQNIDSLETKLPYLHTQVPLRVSPPWPNVVQLHGALNRMQCSRCGYVDDIHLSLFQGGKSPDCPVCPNKIHEAHENRTRAPRPARPEAQIHGKLRPRILLYDSAPEGWENDQITLIIELDIGSPPDVLLVAGTDLDVPGAARLVRSLCDAVHAQGGTTIWVNKKMPKEAFLNESAFDILVIGTCEQFADFVWSCPLIE